MTCHTNNIREEDSEYNVTPHNYPKYSKGKKAHQDINTEISSRI